MVSCGVTSMTHDDGGGALTIRPHNTTTGKPTMLSRRTRTVYQTANPVFEERWKFTAPHYRARLSVRACVVGWGVGWFEVETCVRMCNHLLITRIHTCVQLELMDATRERVVGRTEVPMFALLQRNADAWFDGRRKQLQQGVVGDGDGDEEEEEEEQMLPLRCVVWLETDGDGV